MQRNTFFLTFMEYSTVFFNPCLFLLRAMVDPGFGSSNASKSRHKIYILFISYSTYNVSRETIHKFRFNQVLLFYKYLREIIDFFDVLWHNYIYNK